LSIYIEQIEQLVVLQKVDSEMITLERILEDAPKQLRSLAGKAGYLKQQQGVIQEKVDVLMEQKAGSKARSKTTRRRSRRARTSS
jgi:hypothetical protein